MSIRDAIRAGRRTLHADMAVPALYIATPGATPVPVSVRVHTKFGAIGRLMNNADGAAAEELKPRLIFLVDEIASVARLAVVSVEPGEAYIIDFAQPRDDITITAFVTALDATEAAGLPVPA